MFANPENIKFADMGAIVADVQSQLNGMIGTANLTSAAMAEVWKNLNPQQKAQLRTWLVDENKSYEDVSKLLHEDFNVRAGVTAVRIVSELKTVKMSRRKGEPPAAN